ncbi:MAG: GNAT family N-acetyltransferase [Ardenticatenaceae bacterium]|nr:GNAT family N-acetyltransferase [Ardenticatenaceae bacterium]
MTTEHEAFDGSQSAFLKGERVYLRPLCKTDLPLIQKWSNDPDLRGRTGMVQPMSQAGVAQWYEKAEADPQRIWFIIVLQEGHRPIGEAGLLRMFPAWRTTDLSIIIGEKDVWGQGYGTETINLLLDYAFGYLNFHRVAIGVVGFNEQALRFYEKVGFKQEGVQRDGYFYNHEFSDFVMMSILEDEFRDGVVGKGIS